MLPHTYGDSMIIRNCLNLLNDLCQIEKEIKSLENLLKKSNYGHDLDTILVKLVDQKMEQERGRHNEEFNS